MIKENILLIHYILWNTLPPIGKGNRLNHFTFRYIKGGDLVESG